MIKVIIFCIVWHNDYYCLQCSFPSTSTAHLDGLMDGPVQCQKQPLPNLALKIIYGSWSHWYHLHCLHISLQSASFLSPQLTSFVAEQRLKVKTLYLTTKHLNCAITIVRLIFIITFSISAVVTIFNMDYFPYLNNRKDDEKIWIFTHKLSEREGQKMKTFISKQ